MQALTYECLILSTSFWMGNNVDEQLAGNGGVVKDIYLTSLEKLQSQGHTASQFLLAKCSWNCPVQYCRGFPWAPLKPLWNSQDSDRVNSLYFWNAQAFISIAFSPVCNCAKGLALQGCRVFIWKVKTLGWDVSNCNHLLLETHLSTYVMQSLPGESLLEK